MKMINVMIVLLAMICLGLVMSCSQLKDLLSSPEAIIIEHEVEQIAVEALEEVIKDELK